MESLTRAAGAPAELLQSLLDRLLKKWPIALVGVLLAVFVKRRFLTSIRDLPGPFAASFSRAWLVYHGVKGHTEQATIEEHRKHGLSRLNGFVSRCLTRAFPRLFCADCR